jgi:hypothetical protein
MPKYFSVVLGVLLLVAIMIVLLTVTIPNFIKSHKTVSASLCTNNLRIFEEAKAKWALDHSKMTNDVATWDDILPYLPAKLTNSIPVCLDGGVYTLGRVGSPPTCSIKTSH